MASYSRKLSIPGKSSSELYDSISKHIDHFLNQSFIGKVDIVRDPEHKEVSIKGSLFSAKISCEESTIDINAQLSLVATPFKSKIDEGITHWISKIFKI